MTRFLSLLVIGLVMSANALVDPHMHITTTQFLLQARDVFDVVKEASMPKSGTGAIACALSEAISGAVGAVFSRSAASALNDEKKDSQQAKVINTAAFFGVRGLTRASARIMGVPRPIALVIGSLLASAASETAKLRSREAKQAAPDDEEDMVELSGPEIAGDIAKWICFDLILESLPSSLANSEGVERNTLYFAAGSFSSTIGAALRENIAYYSNEEEGEPKEAIKKTLEKIPKASIEGGILFFVYSYAVNLVGEFLPAPLREELIFARFLDNLEGE